MSLQSDTQEGKSSTSLFALNESAAEAFAEIANYLQIKGENPFKIKAYLTASKVLRSLEEDLEDLCLRGELRSIDGVGKAIADKLEAFITTGSIPQLDALKEEIPPGLVEIAALPGLGAKKTTQLHQELGVCDLRELRQALREEKVEGLKGFSSKSQAKLLVLVEKALDSEPTFLKSRLEEWGRQTIERLAGVTRLVEVHVVGGVRRKSPESSNLELLLVCEDTAAARQDVESRLAENGSRFEERDGSLVLFHPSGCPISLHFCPAAEGGPATILHTGPADFVTRLKEHAGVHQLPAAGDEASLFRQLGVASVPPELRHQPDPWALAQRKLLTVGDLRGNLHAHSTYSDGQNSLREMVETAQESGHEYFGITDHSRSLVIANGLTIERLREQSTEVRALNTELNDFQVFAGSETDILEDGSLDYPDEVLQELDYVVAAVHSFFHLDSRRMTERLVRGLSHPKVRVLAHPTGRLLTRREGYHADWKIVFAHCASRHIALEVNASPWRLDISDDLLDLARHMGCLIAINTDAHSVSEFDRVVHGVDMARRSAFEADSVVNTWTVDRLRGWFATGHRA
jgi:DNA polymerase (family X)